MTTLAVDANNLIFRVWNVTQSLQKKGQKRKVWNEEDMDCSTIHAFMRSLHGVVKSYKPQNVYLCWDKKLCDTGEPNFRFQLIPDYKAGRSTSAEDREEIMSYVLPIVRLTASLGFKNFFPWNLEADDCIAYICRKAVGKVTVATSDKDLLQLVNPNVHYHNFTDRNVVTESNFEEYGKVSVGDFLRFKAIWGDNSDNIDGLKGFGVKRAAKLAKEWDDRYEDLSDEQIEIVKRNMRVMALAEELDDYEVAAYKKQFGAFPEEDVDNFQETAMKHFRFEQRACSDWVALLSNLRKEAAMADFANDIFGIDS